MTDFNIASHKCRPAQCDGVFCCWLGCFPPPPPPLRRACRFFFVKMSIDQRFSLDWAKWRCVLFMMLRNILPFVVTYLHFWWFDKWVVDTSITIQVTWKHIVCCQVPGFLFLVVGMALYNDLIIMPLYRQWKEGRQMVEPGDRPANNRDEERERLLGNTSTSCLICLK